MVKVSLGGNEASAVGSSLVSQACPPYPMIRSATNVTLLLAHAPSIATAEAYGDTVGSGAGAVTKVWGVAVSGGFRHVPVPHSIHVPFPAPAQSNGACGFPALRFPVRFLPRFM
jgi:hypothetical protein